MRLDSYELRVVADRFSAAADAVGDAGRNHLSHLIFGAACAGRDHAADGEAVRSGLDRLAAEVAQWSRAAAEIAVALRSGAERYTDADRYAATGIV